MKIEIKPALAPAAVNRVNELVVMVVSVQSTLGLQKLTFKQRGNQDVFDYQFNQFGINGRDWSQEITFDPVPTGDPLMNFDTDSWRQSEFSLVRDIRQHLIDLYVINGINEVEFTW